MLLYAVRHAQVKIEPLIPPEEWHLSPAGIESARRLVDTEGWPRVGSIHHSPEPKTTETAHAIGRMLGVRLVPTPGLRELRMSAGFLGAEEFEGRVGAYLEGVPDAAFEDYDAARTRVVACVREAVAASEGRAVAVVSHGRLLTVLFSALCGARLGAAAWKSIGMPDVSVVDLSAGRVVRGFFAGRRIDAGLLAPGA